MSGIPENADDLVAAALFESASAGRKLSGPNRMAEEAEALLRELLPLRDAATDRRERKQLSSRIKSARIILNFARTRAGYVPGRR